MGTGGGGFIKKDGSDIRIEGGTDNTNIGNVGDQLIVTDRANDSGVYGAISVGTTAVEAKVGGSPLADRKVLTVYNAGGQSIFWGHSNAVTASTGTELFKNQFISFEYGPNLSVWLVAASGTQDVRVTEAS